MALDIVALRSEFPSLASGIAHFDGPGGTQTPRVVARAISDTLTRPLSNRGRSALSERNADDAVQQFRQAYADFLGSVPAAVVYGRSATQLIYDFSRHLAKTWQPGDEIVLSALDHDGNVRPWIQAARARDVTVRWLEFDPLTAEIDPARLDEILGDRTRLVAVTGASNLLGTKPAVRELADRAHSAGALVFVDGVHYAAHALVDVQAIGADLFVCSPYKFFGPHCAVLTARASLLETLEPDKLLPSSNNVPERFEFGTLPYEIMAGATAAVDFIANVSGSSAPMRRDRLEDSMSLISEHERMLSVRLEQGLADLGDHVIVHSRAASRTPTTLISLPTRSCRDASRFLADREVLAPAGSFYAYEPFRRLGIDDTDGLRIGLAAYNTVDEIDRLVTGLGEFLQS